MTNRDPGVPTLDAESFHIDREMTLGEHVSVIRRHAAVIVTLAISGAVLAGGLSSMRTPLYESTASVVIDRESPGLLSRERESDYEPSPEYLQTHFELLKSHEVLRKTADLLNLSQQPEYQSKPALGQLIQEWKSGLLALVGLEKGNQTKALSVTKEAPHPEWEQLRNHILVSPVRGSRVVHITVQSRDPKFAAKAANTLASVYIDHVIEIKANTKEQASKWFSTHLEELRRKVEESEYNLYVYRSKYGLMDAHERQTVAAQQLTDLNSELVKAEMKRADVQARYQQIVSLLHKHGGSSEPSTLDDATEVLQSPLIQILRTEEIKASAKVAELNDKYGPLHPKMMHAKIELEDFRQRIHKEVQKIYNSIKHEHDATLARVKMIREAVERHKQEKVKLEQHEVEHAILDREAQSNRQLYDTFLRQMKETNLTSGMLMSSIYLADPAVPPELPVSPRPKLNALLGLLAGLLGGLGLAFVMDYRNHSVKGPDDLERYLPGLPVLGAIPLQQNGRKKLLGIVPILVNGHKKRLAGQGIHGDAFDPNMEDWASAEQYRTIRTNILLASPVKGLLSLLVTSPGENEGKTTLAVNLAQALAQLQGFRVALINADLRKVGPGRFLGLQREDAKGLAHYLMGEATFEEILYPTQLTNLWVVPHGVSPSNPSELLHSQRMAELLNYLIQKGFQVIIDAPPVLAVADAMILSAQVEGVVLTISEGETNREACLTAINRITSCGGKLVGVVLQKARLTHILSYARPYVPELNRQAFHVGPQ